MFETIIALLTQVFAFGTKLVPDDKIREENQQLRKQRITGVELIRIYDREFNRLKNHTEITIGTDVKFVDYNLPPDQQQWLIENLTARITAYRLKHKIIFGKWLKQNQII